MKKILSFIICLILFTGQMAAKNGEITITPYLAEEFCNVKLNPSTCKLLNSKLSRIIMKQDAYSGMDNRFILTPYINVISQENTASIPSKTAVLIEITFCIGDGVSGVLFQSQSIEYSGVGDSTDDAVASAISKIKPSHTIFGVLLDSAKEKIMEYYNTHGQTILNMAKNEAANQEFEKAIGYLYDIPYGCKDFEEAQILISQYGSQIVKRNNNSLLLKAKSIWASTQNIDGAEEAEAYISQICITDEKIKKEVNSLIGQINQRLCDINKMEHKLLLRDIERQEAIQTAEISAAAQVKSSLIESAPKVIYNIAKWLIF